MTDLERRILEIQQAKRNKEEGKFNLLPWYYHFPRLSKYVPGLFRGEMVKILSPTGVNFNMLPVRLIKLNNDIFYFVYL